MSIRRLHPGFFTAIWLLPALALLQSSMAPRLVVGGALPMLILITVVDWGILRGPDEGMLWAFVGGLCTDLFTGWPFGTSTVAMVAVASIVSLGSGTFIRTHALLPVGTVFLATVIYYVIAFFILESTQHTVPWVEALRYVVLPIALYNAVLNIPAYMLVRRLEQRVYPVPRANW